MPLLKDGKKKLAKNYVGVMQQAKNVVVIKHQWIPVNEINQMRMDLADAEWILQVVKKRVLLKWIEGNFEGLTLDQMDGSVALLLSENEWDEHAPLKVMQKHLKKWKKEKKEFTIEYVWWWYEGAEWKDNTFVQELADLPSKEELIGKFLFMLNHPVSSLARAIKAIADKDGAEWEIEEPAAEESATPEATDASAAEEADAASETSESTEEESAEEASEE